MKKATILVVEDEAITAKDLEFRLKHMGYDVLAVVATGEDAVEKAREKSPALILMDITLRGDIDGIEAARQIRLTNDIPVVYLSAYTDKMLSERAKDTEPFGYLSKPFAEHDLLNTIQMALYKHDAEKKLREEKKFTEEAIDAQIDTFFVFDPRTGNAIRWNKRFREISGYSDEEIAELKAPDSYYSPEDLQKASVVTNDVLSKGEGRVEMSLICKDGRKIPTEYIASVINDEKGNVKYIISIGRDITERKKSEAQLIDQREYINTILESITHPVYVINVNDYRVVHMNSATRFDKMPDDITCYTLGHGLSMPCDVAEHKCVIKEIIETKKPLTVEHIHYEKGNIPRTVEVRGYPIFDREGKITQVIEYNIDITERKNTEISLKEKSAQLNTIIESLPFDIFGLDNNGQYFIQNTISRKNWGDVVGKRPEDVAPDEKTLALWLDNNRRAFSGEVVKNEVEFPLTDGKARYFFNIITPIRNRKKTFGILGINIDITERRTAEEALKKAKKEIESWNRKLEKTVKDKTEELVKSHRQLVHAEKLSALGQMAGGLAHELNSPLAGLIPMIENLLNKTSNGSKEQEELALMLNTARHMAKLVKDLCGFIRKSKGDFKVLNVNDAIEHTLSFSTVSLRHKGIKVKKELSDRKLLVKGDKTELQQVVLNMLSNAKDATSEGGTLIIKTGASEDMNKVFMEFIDNGAGIEKEIIDKIFGPFFTTKKEGEGTGLGLSVSYGIIKKHGGDISVESEPGKGTRFLISLPAAKAP